MKVVTFIMTKINKLKTFWTTIWPALKQAFVNIWTFIGGFIKTTLNVIMAVFKFIFPAIKFIVMGVFSAIKSLINGALNFIMGVVKVFSGLFTGNWTMLWNGIKQMFQGVIQFIWGYIQLFFGGRFISIIGKFAKGALKWIVKFVKGAGSKIDTFVKGVWNKFTSMVSNVLSTIGTFVKGMVGKIDDFVYKILGKITGFNTDLGLLFAKGWEALKGIAKKALDAVWGVIKDMFSTFKKAGGGLIDAFTGGIKKAFGKAKKAVTDGLAKIRDFLPFSPAKKGALSDLDKSGESFFPTWVSGVMKKLPKATRAIGGAMSSMNKNLQKEAGMMTLDAFTGGKSKLAVTHQHKHSGKVQVDGDNSSEVVEFAGESIKTEADDSILIDFRKVVRSR